MEKTSKKQAEVYLSALAALNLAQEVKNCANNGSDGSEQSDNIDYFALQRFLNKSFTCYSCSPFKSYFNRLSILFKVAFSKKKFYCLVSLGEG